MKKRYTTKQKFLLAITAIICLSAGPYFALSGLETAEPMGAFLNNTFPSSLDNQRTTTVEISTTSPTFSTAMGGFQDPRSDNFFVIQRNGQIFYYNLNSTSKAKNLFLDISDNVWTGQDSGLLGFAFHPDFGDATSENRNYIYTFYVTIRNNVKYIRISRFTKEDNALTAAASSEQILIEQRLDFTTSNLHRGGSLIFGNDGYLYISIGDLGLADESQNITNRLLGGILRIDVDKKGGTFSHPINKSLQSIAQGISQEYYIPNDNPFNNVQDAFQEYYSLGSRNPHKMSIDRQTGIILIGNVGSNSGEKKEEINQLEKGANYGWPFREGTEDRPDLMQRPSTIIGTIKDPLFHYVHGGGSNCIVGGYIYRGTAHPALVGKYVFGDYGSNAIWSINLDGTDQQLLATSSVRFATMAQDSSGEIYIGAIGNHPLYSLNFEPINDNAGALSPPQLLSQTGLFTNTEDLTISEGIIPYTVNAALWSDNSEKQRWIAIPNDGVHNTPEEQISFYEKTDWKFPTGTVLIKHFELALDQNKPEETTKLETRFIVLTGNDEFYGLTYKWNAEGTDAELIVNGEDIDYTVFEKNGQTRTQTWHFPGQSECLVCHTNASGGVLGPKTSQFNGDNFYTATGLFANQLETFDFLNIFDKNLDSEEIPKLITSRNIHDESASVEQRVRSYLDANCAGCHRPDGGPRSEFDLRLTTSLNDQKLIMAEVIENLGIDDAKVIFPGNPQKSILYTRTNQANTLDAMPPLAKSLVDEEAVMLIEQWINSLEETGGGWLATYYTDKELNNKAFERNDLSIDFDWTTVPPTSNFQETEFSVSWEGILTTRFNEEYTFSLLSDDGVRMWVDNELIIDDWNVFALKENQGKIALSQGEHNVRVEYFQNAGEANIHLFWESESQSRELVPAMYVKPAVINEIPESSIGEVNTISIDHNWKTVYFESEYNNPVVIVGGLSYNGGNQSTVRVREVNSSSFQVKVDEWDCLDGSHTIEQTSYLVVEAGIYELENGKILQAGNLENVTDNWESQTFDIEFNQTPLVFGQCITNNEEDAVNVFFDENVTSTTEISLKLKEQDRATGGHSAETVSWVAVESGTISNSTNNFEMNTSGRVVDEIWETISFSQTFQNTPLFIGNIASEYGGDAAALRYQNLGSQSVQVFVEEETCGDTEIGHTNEEVNYMAFANAGFINGVNLIIDNPPSNINLALTKPTEQSTTSHGGVASRAVDGNVSGNWKDGSVTHTKGSPGSTNPWWKVDLGAVYPIGDIHIYNRTNCCSSRLNGAKVMVGSIDSNTPSDYIEVATLNDTSEQIINAEGVEGQYVYIYLEGNNKILSLAEVEVYEGEKSFQAISLISPVLYDENDVTIYPNPLNSGQNIIVKFNSNLTTRGAISIINMNGQIVSIKDFSVQIGNNSQEISTNSYSSGMYIVMLRFNGNEFTRKVFVN